LRCWQNSVCRYRFGNWGKLFESPFKREIYFFSTRQRLNQKWGTSNPITIRDREFGAVRLRAFGIYTFRIAAPRVFYQKVSGTRDFYAVGDLEGQLRNSIIAVLTDHFAESNIPFLDMAANQVELGAAVADKMRPMFADLGLALESFHVQNISLPDELQKRLDERIGMGVVGDLGRYTQFQTAQSIPKLRRRGRNTILLRYYGRMLCGCGRCFRTRFI